MRPIATISDTKLAAEREQLLHEIETVFAGVTREGGVSWSEADVIDDDGTDEERAMARAKDTDRCWADVLRDPDWNPDAYQFSYLDAIGFRYYLAPAMAWTLRTLYCFRLNFHLIAPDDDLRALERLSLLSPRQNLCVARFVKFMGQLERSQAGVHAMKAGQSGGADNTTSSWREALSSRWVRFLDASTPGE